VDGNKRVGAAAAFVFLALNDFRLTANPADFEELVMFVARGKTSKSSMTSFFRKNSASA
jgi:death-on-curing protein